MLKFLLKYKTTAFQRKRQAAPSGTETKTIKQIRRETKKKLGLTETEAEFKRRLQQIQEHPPSHETLTPDSETPDSETRRLLTRRLGDS